MSAEEKVALGSTAYLSTIAKMGKQGWLCQPVNVCVRASCSVGRDRALSRLEHEVQA